MVESLFPLALIVAYALLTSMGPVLLLGPLALICTVRTSGRLGVQEVKDEELSDAQRQWLGKLDRMLGSQGFVPALTFRAVELPGRNLSRVYLSSGDPAVAVASSITHEGNHLTLAKTWVEFGTDFADGTSVLTTSVVSRSGMVAVPGHVVHEHPRVRNPIALKQKHDAHTRPELARGARFYRTEELPAVMERDHERKMRHQVQASRYRRCADGRYAPRFWTAVRLTLQFLNPFAAQNVQAHVVAALALVVLPVLGTALLGIPEVGWLAWVQRQVPGLAASHAWLLAFAPVAVAGGVLLGISLEARAVPWAFFIPLAEFRVLMPQDGAPFAWVGAIAVTLVGVKASLIASDWANKRCQKV